MQNGKSGERSFFLAQTARGRKETPKNEPSDVEDGDNSETSSKNLELDNNEGLEKDSEAGESEEKSPLSET